MLESHFEYDAWGNDLGGNFTTNAQNVSRYRTGKFFDDVTGLYYNQARWYDPTLGRFISESPIAPFAEEDYDYCGNDPVNFVDVNGLERTLREKTVDTLSELANYIFDHTLTPILNNLIPQNRANTPPGLFPGGKECTSVSNDLEDLSHVVADDVLSQIEDRFPPLNLFFFATTSYHNLLEYANEKYPSKVGKWEKHHLTPKYLGGEQNGPTVDLPAPYHQLITNEFRNQHPYGQSKPSRSMLKKIMDKVYKIFPINKF